jgi:hypothetical protein
VLTIHSGSCPAPFSGRNGHALAGPDGSHPLHAIRIPDLITPSSGAVDGQIRIDGPVVVGQAIRGHLSARATGSVRARGAALRLVGLRLVERRESETHEEGAGDTRHTVTDSWVEANGSLFEQLPFTEPAVPSNLAAGEAFEADFVLPAPQLGPPAAHLGEAIVAWALEARWDVAFGEDSWIATPLEVLQNPDLIRAGVGRQGGLAMLDVVTLAEGATIGVGGDKPLTPGSQLTVEVTWPGASDGHGRVELHRRTNAPNGEEAIVASIATTGAALRAGMRLDLGTLAAGLPPSFDGADLENSYIIRVLIDRRFRTDQAIERPIAIL